MADKKTKDTGFAPNWRPDFRDNDVLPDVKAVRTNFLVNFVALALAILATGYFGIKEFDAMSLQSEIDSLNESIKKDSPANRTNLKASGSFTKASPKVEDLVAFYKGYHFPLDVLLEICESRPETIALQSMSFSKASKNIGSNRKPKIITMPRYTLSGVVKGDSQSDLSELKRYEATLKELDIFKDRIESVELSKPKQLEGLFEFTIVVNLKATK